MLDDHTVNLRVEICQRTRFRLTQNVYRIFQIREFCFTHRREAWVTRGRADGVVDELFREAVFNRFDRADAPAEFSVKGLD